MSDTPLFSTLDGSTLQSDFLQLLSRLVRDKGRIEVTNCGGESCVMISKAELDSLEQALEILANTDEGRKMARTVERFARMAKEAMPS